MTPVRPEFVPTADRDHEEMAALQRRVAEDAVFVDDLPFDPATVSLAETPPVTGGQRPLVAGVDQAFLDDRAVSAVVVLRGGEVVERTYAVSETAIPYVPGLLSFREGGPILDAVATLSVEPNLFVFDGSGRLHFRQAGLATHLGVTLDAPAIGVAKSLLCGTPAESTADRPEGWLTPIRVADGDDVDAPPGTVVGHAYQSRQWDRPQSINPLFVSPGHRVGADTAVDLVASLCDGRKLPEPTRLADDYAETGKREVVEGETETGTGTDAG
ncbi:MAG: endonuclease V [Halolamina sp.]